MFGSFNLDQVGLDRIAGGTQTFVVDQQGYLQGFMAVFLLDAALNYQITTPSQPILTGPVVVDASTAAAVAEAVEAFKRERVPTMTDPVRWGILGAARIAEGAILPGLCNSPAAVPLAIAARDKDRAAAMAGRCGVALLVPVARGAGRRARRLARAGAGAVHHRGGRGRRR
jgi:hypothetical protein